MAVSRLHSKGPVYHQPHKVGSHYVWDTINKRWNFLSYWYCPGSVNWVNYWYSHKKLCQDETHPGPPWKDGGPLFIKEWINPPFHSPGYACTSPNGMYKYTGSFYNSHPGIDSNYDLLQAQANLGTTYGATGWNRFRPVKSGADLGQFLAELRDFKSLFRFRLKSFKDLGSSYLNVQFGWKPFLKDIDKFFKSMEKVERTINFIRKNNNKWLTRGGTITRNEVTGTEEVLQCRIYPQLNTYYHLTYPISQSYTKRIPREEERIWFKARMKYYIPDLSVDKCENVLSSRLLRRIYGLEATPALVWELTPWSWLVDWFGNIGDVLANISSSSYDNLTAKYAYVMRSWSKTLFYNSYYKFSSREGVPPIKLSSSTVLSTKQRAEASPFGFHLGWADLSPYQLSILAALGLSRQ